MKFIVQYIDMNGKTRRCVRDYEDRVIAKLNVEAFRESTKGINKDVKLFELVQVSLLSLA